MRKRLMIVMILILMLSSCGVITRPKTEYVLHEGKDTIMIGETWVDAGMSIKYGVSDLDVSIKSNNVDTTKAGAYEVIYQATYGKTTYTFTRYVFVLDNTGPLITLNPGLDSIQVGNLWEDAGVTVDAGVAVEVIGDVDYNVAGNYVVTYKATNQLGIVSYLYRVVTVYS